MKRQKSFLNSIRLKEVNAIIIGGTPYGFKPHERRGNIYNHELVKSYCRTFNVKRPKFMDHRDWKTKGVHWFPFNPGTNGYNLLSLVTSIVKNRPTVPIILLGAAKVLGRPYLDINPGQIRLEHPYFNQTDQIKWEN